VVAVVRAQTQSHIAPRNGSRLRKQRAHTSAHELALLAGRRRSVGGAQCRARCCRRVHLDIFADDQPASDDEPLRPELALHAVLVPRRPDDQVNERLPGVGDLPQERHSAWGPRAPGGRAPARKGGRSLTGLPQYVTVTTIHGPFYFDSVPAGVSVPSYRLSRRQFLNIFFFLSRFGNR